MISLLQAAINVSKVGWIRDNITVNTARYMVIVSKDVTRSMDTHQDTDFTIKGEDLQQLSRLICLVFSLILHLLKPVYQLLVILIPPTRLLF